MVRQAVHLSVQVGQREVRRIELTDRCREMFERLAKISGLILDGHRQRSANQLGKSGQIHRIRIDKVRSIGERNAHIAFTQTFRFYLPSQSRGDV